MVFRLAIRDYETLCAIVELEAEIDGCESLIEVLERHGHAGNRRLVQRLRTRASDARALVCILCEEARPTTFDA